MKKIILGIIMGIALSLLVGKTYASQTWWKISIDPNDVNTGTILVHKITDGNVDCYIEEMGYSGYAGTDGISCIKK